MFNKNIIFHQGPIKVLEKLHSSQWSSKQGVLIQSGLLILASQLIDEKVEGKLKLGKILIGLCQVDNEWQIDLQQDKKVSSFRVDSLESAEKWHKMLVFASSWASYKRFCEMQKVQPWIYLLQWAAKADSKLVVDLANCNSFALTEFLKGNSYIQELILQGVKNEVIVLTRILVSLHPDQLRVLSLSKAGFDDKSLEKAKKPLKSLNYLKQLDLSFNEFSCKSILILFQIFRKMPYLEVFDFSGHRVEDKGFQMFFPEILSEIPISNFLLASCGFTDSSLQLLFTILKLNDASLKLLDLRNNQFSLEGLKTIFKVLNKVPQGKRIDLKLFPLNVDEDIVKYLDTKVYVLNRNLIKKTLPLDYRSSVESISKKITNLGENPFVEDLAELINDLSKLGIPLPRTKQEKIEKIVNDYLSIAATQPNFYCLETLVPVLRKIGFRHALAEEQLHILTNEVEHILSTLESVLTPSLYTYENIPELNSLLDSVLRRCDEICVRGEIVHVAKVLKAKRDEWIEKLKK